MKLKSILAYIGIGVLLFILYKLFFGVPSTVNVDVNKPFVAPTEKVAPVTETKPVEVSEDQKTIDALTAQINAGNTDNGNANYQRGVAYLHAKDYRPAIIDFNITLKLVPNSPYVLYNRALAYMGVNDYTNAVADLTQAIKYKADFADAYNTRGLAYVEMQSYDLAKADYEKALSLNDKFPDVYFNQGTLFMRMKQYSDAKKSFEEAITNSTTPANSSTAQVMAIQTKLMQAYLNLARAEFMMGELENALKDASYVVSNDPKNVEALRLRSDIYTKLGNSAAAAVDSSTADTMSMQQMLDKR